MCGLAWGCQPRPSASSFQKVKRGCSSLSLATLWTVARFLCPWTSLGKNTGVGSHFLLWGIFVIQGSNLHLLHWQVNRFFTIRATREAHFLDTACPLSSRTWAELVTESLPKSSREVTAGETRPPYCRCERFLPLPCADSVHLSIILILSYF